MDRYEVIRLVGEGSFGRVFQAKQKENSRIVALKVISKRGRSQKELKGLRRECDIQRHLHHPNIIQMLDSFETDDEIYVITEFAHKELFVILGKEGYLPEERVQAIVWDLVSALYYLHSHRVLHRDLKPQNILLDVNDCAKLCDFGFARNMTTGTHVLTSIKGTPLYMAPELIEEHPYDHNADLWSLGCIIYELLVGAPPFCTTSILHLVRLIRHEQVQWPNFISEICVSFLQGLLQKDPAKRMTWPEILQHPFVEGHIIVTEDDQTMPLTRPLPPLQLEAKERQLQDLAYKSAGHSKTVGTSSSSIDCNHDLDRITPTNSCNVSCTSEDFEELYTCATDFVNSTAKVEHNDTNKNIIDNSISSEESFKLIADTRKISQLTYNSDTSVVKSLVVSGTPEKYIKSREGHLTKLSQNLDNFAKKINNSESLKSRESEVKSSISKMSNKFTLVANRMSLEQNSSTLFDSKRETQNGNREGNIKSVKYCSVSKVDME